MKSEHKKRWGIGLLISLLLAALVFVALVIFSGILTAEPKSKTVVIATCRIPRNTVVRAEEIENCFATVNVDEDLAYEGTFASLEELKAVGDLYLTDTVYEREILSKERIAGSNELVEGFTEPVEMGIRVTSFEYAAGGTLRRGDTVDLCNTDYTGTEESIRVYILQAFDNTGTLLSAGDEAGVATAFNILIEREDYAQVAEILSMGSSYDLVKVNDVY